jgi:hypothetical protein
MHGGPRRAGTGACPYEPHGNALFIAHAVCRGGPPWPPSSRATKNPRRRGDTPNAHGILVGTRGLGKGRHGGLPLRGPHGNA